ncbi:MAG: methyltransferase domain-containing protein [Candidatus Magasanikbacteria bacterium]|jgi:ubiquinone/menaquinone biosynthesis C-methylase UbiE
MTHAGTALIDPKIVFDKIGLTVGMRVADLGCGRTGHFVFPVARVVGDTGVVYAIDVVKDILESLNSRVRSEGFGNVHTVWSDIEMVEKTPIPAGSLDVAFFVNVMYLLRDKESALREASRLLKDGGQIVLIDWSKNLGPLGPKDGVMVSPSEMIEHAQISGLNLMENINLGDYHFCLIFKKN